MERDKVMHGKLRVFAGQAGIPLATEVCKKLSLPLSKATVQRFSDGEVRIQLLEDVRDSDVFIINPTNPPAENFFDMCLLAQAAQGSSAGRITLVPSYLGYNRQDRKDRPRVPISARWIARMLSQSGTNRMLLLDLHSEPTAAFFDSNIVVDHLYSSSVSIEYLKGLLHNEFVVASPDKGGGPRAEAYAKRLDLGDYVVFIKSRPQPNEVQKDSIKIIGDVNGKDIIFIDDLIDTAGTIIADAEAAQAAGAKDIYVFATHALFSQKAIEHLDRSCIKEVVITDSIHHEPVKLQTKRVKITILSIAELLGKAIRCVHEGESVSSLIV